MKTKRIEIKPEFKEWSLRSNDCICEVFIGRETYDKIKSRQTETKVTLTFEVPVPEPSVSITPSKISDLYYQYHVPQLPKYESFADFLKHKLFPDWEG